MRIPIGSIALIIAFLAAPASLDAQTALSLDDCVRLALDAPSAATAAQSEADVAREEQTVARAAMLPQVHWRNGLVYNSPLPGRDGSSFVASNGVREYLSLLDSTWDVDLSGRLRAGVAGARAGRDLAGADLRIARRDLRREVAAAYYDLLLARRLALFVEDALAAARDFEKLTRARQEQGEASLADVAKAAALRSRFEQRRSQAVLDARLANQTLASFWTTDADRELDLAESLEGPAELPAELAAGESAEIEPLVGQRPEFDRLDALRRSFEAQRAAARAALLPQATLVFQYGIDANEVRVAERGYAAFLQLDIPIFDWFQSRGAARQARYRQQRVEQEQAVAKRAFSREYLAAKARARSWFERISQARQESTDSRENLRLARLLYESGEGLALDVVTAQTESTEAGVAYYSAIAAYRRALIDFETAAGR